MGEPAPRLRTGGTSESGVALTLATALHGACRRGGGSGRRMLLVQFVDLLRISLISNICEIRVNLWLNLLAFYHRGVVIHQCLCKHRSGGQLRSRNIGSRLGVAGLD